MNRNALIATVAGFICAAISITVPVGMAIHSRTVRETACVNSGASWLHVSDTTVMECKR